MQRISIIVVIICFVWRSMTLVILLYLVCHTLIPARAPQAYPTQPASSLAQLIKKAYGH